MLDLDGVPGRVRLVPACPGGFNFGRLAGGMFQNAPSMGTGASHTTTFAPAWKFQDAGLNWHFGSRIPGKREDLYVYAPRRVKVAQGVSL